MNHVTLEDWQKARYLTKVAKVGDIIANGIIDKLLNTSPPSKEKQQNQLLQSNEVIL